MSRLLQNSNGLFVEFFKQNKTQDADVFAQDQKHFHQLQQQQKTVSSVESFLGRKMPHVQRSAKCCANITAICGQQGLANGMSLASSVTLEMCS